MAEYRPVTPPPARKPTSASDINITAAFHSRNIIQSRMVKTIPTFLGIKTDPFVFVDENKYLEFQIRGKPVAQARSIKGKNGNYFSKTKCLQDEFADLINNILDDYIHVRTPNVFLCEGFLSVELTFVFGVNQTREYFATDIDNMAKFVFDAMTTAGIIEDDRKIDKSSIMKFQVNENCVFPDLAEFGGVIVRMKMIA
jgi:Holliday junction resolvase RusA-like endonuclease